MEVLKKYKELAASCPNITFHEGGLVDAKLLNSADVLLSDASSVIVEAMMLDKPVVTYLFTWPNLSTSLKRSCMGRVWLN